MLNSLRHLARQTGSLEIRIPYPKKFFLKGGKMREFFDNVILGIAVMFLLVVLLVLCMTM